MIELDWMRVWNLRIIKPAKSFPFMPFVFLFFIYFSILSRFPSYIEGNVEFKCGDGKLSYKLVLSHKNLKKNTKKLKKFKKKKNEN
ncbi:hypothetical protein Hanom_Chr09g00771951 [Helianthus anomalus]